MPRKPSLDGKDSSLRIRMSPEQKDKRECAKAHSCFWLNSQLHFDGI